MGVPKVDQAQLVLNMFVIALENKLTSGQVYSWRKHDGEFDDRNGLKLVEQFRPRFNVTRTENGIKDLTTGTQAPVFGSELFAITGTFGTDMGWSDFARIQTVEQAREDVALQGAAESLAHSIDAYNHSTAALASNNWVGTVGNNVATHLDAMQALTRLRQEGVTGTDLHYVLNSTDQMLLGDQVIKLPAPDGMATAAYRNGYKNMISDVPTLFTEQLPVLTVGTRVLGAALVNGAAQNVNYTDVAVQTTVNGRYLTQTIAIDGLAAGATIRRGEVFTYPGVFAYDNRKQALVQPPRLQQFTVVDDATANGAGQIAELRISPAMIVPGSGAGQNIAINTAHATVDAAPADNAALTFLGAANAQLAPRLLVDKQAIEINTMDLVMPPNTPDARRQRLPNLPLSVRMWPNAAFNTGEFGVRFDVAINANIRDRRRIVRLNGS